jgi:uncharacterized protein YbaA (DUF1428 family)
MKQMAQMPFDGKRLIYSGFKPIVEKAAGRWAMDGYLVAVPATNRQAYRDMAAKSAAVLGVWRDARCRGLGR